MWSKVGKYMLYALLWGSIVGYVAYSASLARSHQKGQTIESVEIIIADSAMHGNLITTPMVERWIDGTGVDIVGSLLSEIPLGDIEGEILKNGFVNRAKIYPTYSGVLRVELTQRRPVMRLLMNGYNGYTTREGYIFEAPNYASLYVPIVTGSYRPPFPPSYRGSIGAYMESQSRLFEEQIMEIEREKYPIYEREEENLEDMRELRRMFISKGWFESRKEFDQRVTDLRAKKAELRKIYRYRSGVIAEQIAKIAAKQQSVVEEEKNLQKRCEDFMNLINFVHIVENDRFWGAEVVQIVTSQSPSGELRVTLSVRSGDFEVIFGAISGLSRGEIEDRFEKLMEFYENGLRRVGWSRFKTINVEYKGQVVCK